MSRVVVATAFGGPEVLSVVEQPDVPPGPGEAVLEVRAAGINPADWKAYTGEFGRDPSRLPLRLGYEVAGVVSAVGEDATGPSGPLSVGDEVIGFRVQGGYADRLVVPASALVPKPAGLDWPAAAGLMLTGATAVHALTATGVGDGDTVLVHGAAGGVGLTLVQLARARGARVIGTAGGDSADLVARLGGEPVALRRGARRPGPGPGARRGGRRHRRCRHRRGGRRLPRAGRRPRPDRHASPPSAGADAGIQLLGDGPGADPGTEIRDAARLELVRLVADGRFEVVVAGTHPLDDVAAAHREGMAGHTHGKLVLLP